MGNRFENYAPATFAELDAAFAQRVVRTVAGLAVFEHDFAKDVPVFAIVGGAVVGGDAGPCSATALDENARDSKKTNEPTCHEKDWNSCQQRQVRLGPIGERSKPRARDTSR